MFGNFFETDPAEEVYEDQGWRPEDFDDDADLEKKGKNINDPEKNNNRYGLAL